MTSPADADIPLASPTPAPPATADLRYEKADPRLSRGRSTFALFSLLLALVPPLMFLVAVVHQSLERRPMSPTASSLFIGMLLVGPLVGVVASISALLLRPRRHLWAAITALCIAGMMLLFSIVVLLGVLH